MKKLFVILAVLLVAVCAFAQGAEEKAPEQTGPIQVDYWRCYTGNNADFVDGIIAEFNAMQDKYVVVPEYNGGYYDQLAKLMATDQENLPALCNSSSETVGSYYHSGCLRMAQDFIDKDPSWNYDFYGNLVSTYGIDGKLVGIPLGFSLSGFFYNVEVFDAAGIDPRSLTSFDRVYEAAIKICEGGYAKYAISEEHSGIWANYCFHREGYYTVDNENGTTALPTRCLYNEGDLKEVCYNYYNEWADLAKRGYTYPFGAAMKTELIPALAAGDLAMLVTTNSYKARIAAACAETGKHFAFVPMFSATDKGKATGYCASGNGFFIVDNGNEAAQQGAYEFVKYFESPDVQMRWMISTGYIPMNDTVRNSAEYQNYLATDDTNYDHYIEYTLDCLEKSDYSAFYAFTAVNNTYSPAGATCLEAVLNGGDVQAAIDAMVKTIDDAFTMYNKTNK